MSLDATLKQLEAEKAAREKEKADLAQMLSDLGTFTTLLQEKATLLAGPQPVNEEALAARIASMIQPVTPVTPAVPPVVPPADPVVPTPAVAPAAQNTAQPSAARSAWDSFVNGFRS